jgi:hypothetical protein
VRLKLISPTNLPPLAPRGVNGYVNCLWLEWPITWTPFVGATLLALYGVFSIATVIEGCVASLMAAIPLVIVLWMKPDFHVLKQLWLAAVTGLFEGKAWVGMIR